MVTRLEQNRIYLNFLYHIPGLGTKRLRRLLANMPAEEICKMPDAMLQAYIRAQFPGNLTECGKRCETGELGESKEAARMGEMIVGYRRKTDPVCLYDKLLKHGISFVPITDPGYPCRLHDVPDPPFGLYVKGNSALLESRLPVAAVIGTRECSEYGRLIAKQAGKICAQRNMILVSGMARGIDGIAQGAALEAGGCSVGVLGCGVDICYPACNRRIYEKLVSEGAVVSEYLPGTAPHASLFPPRNRIISGLSDALIVVEAREKSGTGITIDMALEQGKDVYVVPGRLTDPLSAGCNRIISQGAQIIFNMEETVAEIAGVRASGAGTRGVGAAGAGTNCVGATGVRTDVQEGETMRQNPAYREETGEMEQKLLLDVLDYAPKTTQRLWEEVNQKADVTMPQLHKLLLTLELEGLAGQIKGRYFRRG